MKKSFVLFVVVFFVFNYALLAQISEIKEINNKEFDAKVQEWKVAYNSGNAQNLVPLYANEAIYTSSHVPGLEAIGRDKVIANFQNGISSGGHIDEIEILKKEVSCDQASLYCRYQATNAGTTVTGRNLLVLKRINNIWLIIYHMTVV